MNIRFATKNDISAIEKINTFFDTEYENPSDFFLESILHNRLLVAKKKEKIIGYLVYQILWGNTPILALVRVHPDFQRKNIGQEMVLFFEEELRKKGFTEYISSHEIVNIISENFHKKLEMKCIGKLEMIYGKEKFYRKKI